MNQVECIELILEIVQACPQARELFTIKFTDNQSDILEKYKLKVRYEFYPPRGSLQWKSKMKERTAAERVNNRILHHYGLENSRMRGNKRISFFATVAALMFISMLSLLK